MVYEALKSGYACIFVLFDHFPGDIRFRMREFGWNVEPFEEENRLCLVDCVNPRFYGKTYERYAAMPDLDAVLKIALEKCPREMTGERGLLVFDSLNTLIAQSDPDVFLGKIQSFNKRVKKAKLTHISTLLPGVVGKYYLDKLKDCYDGIIRLTFSLKAGIVRTLLYIEKMPDIYQPEAFEFVITNRGVVLTDRRSAK